MHRLKLIMSVTMIAVAFVTLLVAMGEKSQKYASDTMLVVAEDLTYKYSQLHERFGSVEHFYQALQKAVVKDGSTVTDLLIQDEKVVQSAKADEYEKELSDLPDLASMMHVHIQENDTSYVVGGYPLIGVESREDSESIAVFYGPVRKPAVMQLEYALDGKSMIKDNDKTGRVQYNRHEAANGQYVVGLYL